MALRRAEMELDILYNYYLDICEDKYSGGPLVSDVSLNQMLKYPTNNNLPFYNSQLTYFMIDYYRKNTFPQIVSDNIYNNKFKDAITVYRGEKRTEFARILLSEWDYHYGAGAIGDGIYATDYKVRAEAYKRDKRFGELLEFKINPDANIISIDYLNTLIWYVELQTKRKGLFNREKISMPPLSPEVENKLNILIKYLDKVRDEGFRKCFINSDSNIGCYRLNKYSSLLAVYLGIDAIVCDRGIKDYAILNRGALVISNSEYNKIMGIQNER